VEVLVPFVAELVPEVDPAAGTLTIDSRRGLLDPENDEVDDPNGPPRRGGPR
jgi:hypothetical protein